VHNLSDDVLAVVDDRLPDWGLTRTERLTAAHELKNRGVHPAETARLLGVTERTVYRWRAQKPKRLACDPETGSHPDQPTHPAA
jgi:transposase-like protein